uniref:Peptidase M12A domain-containing protein n=1 Tax=Romanomermis culicivorax TaxID=13658 RepID=A0A915KEB9_ROMCU
MHLSPNFCKSQSSILHLLMHVLGFDHEHVRNDRIYFLSIGFYPDDWIANEYNRSLHHNTYEYMPYNWDR